jgi:23S rRNA-intervening sequence protein
MNSEARIQESESKPLAPAKSFEQLIVWQKALQLVLELYRFTEKFPRNETYGLVSQARRAAISVPANIAEGFKKRGRADKSPISKYRPRITRRMPILSDSGERFELR